MRRRLMLESPTSPIGDPGSRRPSSRSDEFPSDALSRRKQGFESPRERQKYQGYSTTGDNWCPGCVPFRQLIFSCGFPENGLRLVTDRGVQRRQLATPSRSTSAHVEPRPPCTDASCGFARARGRRDAAHLNSRDVIPSAAPIKNPQGVRLRAGSPSTKILISVVHQAQ